MPRISIDYYDLREGDPIDNPLVAAIASAALSNGIKDPKIIFIPCLYGTDDDKQKIIEDLIAKSPKSYIGTMASISPFKYPPNKYTIEKQGDDDPREIIPVDDVIKSEIDDLNKLGFELIFDSNTCDDKTTFCIYTGTASGYDPANAKDAIKFIRDLPEENPQPTHMRVTQEELAKMMGGGTNDEEAAETAEE